MATSSNRRSKAVSKIIRSYLGRRKTPATTEQIINGTMNRAPQSSASIARELRYMVSEGEVRNLVGGRGRKGKYELV